VLRYGRQAGRRAGRHDASVREEACSSRKSRRACRHRRCSIGSVTIDPLELLLVDSAPTATCALVEYEYVLSTWTLHVEPMTSINLLLTCTHVDYCNRSHRPPLRNQRSRSPTIFSTLFSTSTLCKRYMQYCTLNYSTVVSLVLIAGSTVRSYRLQRCLR